MTAKTVIACEETGIVLELLAPKIPNIALTWASPFTTPENFLGVAKLEYNILVSLDRQILAGILIAVLKHWELLESRDAVAENKLLQSIPNHNLITYIRFFSGLIEGRKYSYLPRVAISPRLEGEPHTASTFHTMEGYYKKCREILFPTRETAELERIYDEVDMIQRGKLAEAMIRARKARKVQQKKLLATGKKLISSMEYRLPEKVASFLKLLFKKDYLKTAEQETKDRAIAILGKFRGIEGSQKLAAIIKNPIFNAGSTLSDEDDIEIEEELEGAEKVTPSSPLAAKLHALIAAKKAAKQKQQQEVEEEDMEYSNEVEEEEDSEIEEVEEEMGGYDD